MCTHRNITYLGMIITLQLVIIPHTLTSSYNQINKHHEKNPFRTHPHDIQQRFSLYSKYLFPNTNKHNPPGNKIDLEKFKKQPLESPQPLSPLRKNVIDFLCKSSESSLSEKQSPLPITDPYRSLLSKQ